MAKEYNGWIIFREYAAMANRVYHSILRKSDYEAAQRGEIQFPVKSYST